MSRFRTAAAAVLAAGLLAAAGAVAAPAAQAAQTYVFHVRYQGLMADATWTTCPDPAVGDVCRDTLVIAFDATTREGNDVDRTPVLRTLTFVYRVVGGEFGTVPVAEWFGRLEGASVSGTSRLTAARATGVVPVQVCTVLDETSGITCPTAQQVDVTWTGAGDLARFDDRSIIRSPSRTELAWTRGTTRPATATGEVGTLPLGTFVAGSLTRADQGEFVVQHPFE